MRAFSPLCFSMHLHFGALDWSVINVLNGSFRWKCALSNHKHLAWMDTHVDRVVWLNLVFKLDLNETQHHVGDTLLSQRQHSLGEELGSMGSKRAPAAEFLLGLIMALIFLKLQLFYYKRGKYSALPLSSSRLTKMYRDQLETTKISSAL